MAFNRFSVFVLFFIGGVWSQTPPVVFGSIQLPKQIQVGKNIDISITIPSPWHIQSNNPDDQFAFPSQLSLTSSSFEFGNIIWPKPEIGFDQILQIKTSTFSKTIHISVPIKKIKKIKKHSLQAKFEYQSCGNGLCLAPAQIILTPTKND
jgi:hypothetical protein